MLLSPIAALIMRANILELISNLLALFAKRQTGSAVRGQLPIVNSFVCIASIVVLECSYAFAARTETSAATL